MKISPHFARHRRKNQAGMVLLLCLLFLTALTLLGLSASADMLLQNKLAANLQESEHARQAALATLSWAENWLLELQGPAPETCTDSCDGLYVHAPGQLPADPEFEELSWWQTQGQEAGLDPRSGERTARFAISSASPPVWIMEAAWEVPAADDGSTDLQVWYRLLARGTGRTGTGISVVESIVTRPWPATAKAGPRIAAIPADPAGISICKNPSPGTACGRVSWRELR